MMFSRVFRRKLATKCDVLQLLRQRGLVQQVSQPEQALVDKLKGGTKVKLYCGADPTARSLHLGNLLPLMVLLNFYVRGHDVVALIGGATGRVGDPSGRKTERDAMADDRRLDNVSRIQTQFERFFQNGLKYYGSRIDGPVSAGTVFNKNNYTWWHDVKMLDFLAQYGRHIRIQNMLNRDSVSSRLQSQDGIGFNEFTYQILQAYDFYHLHKNEGVNIQVGGNDQWGNITAGLDLITRVSPQTDKSKQPYGITVPLLTTSTGEKFGKSAGNAIFIDPEMNTSYDMYQFFVNTTDADVEKLLKMFTLLPIERINDIMLTHNESPQLRYAQKRLAVEVVDLIHGVGKGHDSETVSRILFDTFPEDISSTELIRIFDEVNILQRFTKNIQLSNMVCELLQCSKSEFRRKLKQGSIYLGPTKQKVTVDLEDVSPYLIDNEVLLLRVGKQKCYVIKCE